MLQSLTLNNMLGVEQGASIRQSLIKAKEAEQKWEYTRIRGGYGSYDSTFGTLLEKRSIAALIEDIKSKSVPDHPRVAAADIMGSGWVFLRKNFLCNINLFDKGLDYGLAVGMRNERGKLRQKWDRMRNRDIDFIKGDVQLHSTWRKVDQALEKRNLDGFDLMLFRPFAGINTINPELYGSILKDAYRRLTSRNGILLIEYTYAMIDSVGLQDLEFARRASDAGIGCKVANTEVSLLKLLSILAPLTARVMRLDKSPSSPKEITFI